MFVHEQRAILRWPLMHHLNLLDAGDERHLAGLLFTEYCIAFAGYLAVS